MDVPPTKDEIRRKSRDEASSWTETPKSVLVLNAVFPDDTTPVASQAEWQSVMSEVSDWLAANSFGKTNLVVTVPPDIFTLPVAKSTYEPDEDYSQIMSDAKELAADASYDHANFDITVVAFPRISEWGWSGRAGGSVQWLNGNRSAGTIAHEFGHNYGLSHASSWDANDGTVMPATGAPGTSDPLHGEYGDRYSAMGSNSGDYPDGDYSPHGKAALNWIIPSQIEEITAPGTYRIFRFDHALAGANPRLAMKLQRGDSQTFWLGYRRNYTSNGYLSNGGYLLWQFTASRCRLLDTTPDSATSSNFADKEDAALAIGQTFADPTGSLYITPSAQGGTAPNEWLDVRVEFTVAGNRAPDASISLPPGEVAARSEVTLRAVASDPDDDPLVYFWDFGNGNTAHGPEVDWTFLAGGNREVYLRVSDGKGGLAEVTETINVSDPLAQIEEALLPGSAILEDGTRYKGLHLAAGNSHSFASPDGLNWQQSPESLGFTVERLVGADDRFVAAGRDYNSTASAWVATTTVTLDGANWSIQQHGAFPSLDSIAFRDGLWVAVGDDGTILTSPDGSTWTPQSAPTTIDLNQIIATDTGFIVCGASGTILTSPDGFTWTERTTPDSWPILNGIALHGSEVLCPSGSGEVLRSEDDGLTWQDVTTTLADGFAPSYVLAADGRLFLTRYQGIRVYDPNSRTWEDASVQGPLFGTVRGVVRHGSVFVAVANRYDSTFLRNRYFLLVSLDGLNWEATEMVWNNSIVALFSCGNELLAGGPSTLLANLEGAPRLLLEPAAVEIVLGTGETSPGATVLFGNGGAGSLQWTVFSDAPWLESSPSSGIASVFGIPVTVQILSAPPAGEHSATLTFSAPGVPDRTLSVALTTYVDDHSGSREGATALTLGVPQIGEIQAAEDSDWFRLDLAAPGTLTVWTTGDLDTFGELHGESGRLRTDHNSGDGANFRIETLVLPGSYWVRVDGLGSRTGAYQLHSSFVPDGPPFALQSLGPSADGTQWEFSVTTAAGYRYHVEWNDTLEGPWTRVGDVVTAAGPITILTIPPPDPAVSQRFYRIAMQLP